jgi:hypothetical protein
MSHVALGKQTNNALMFAHMLRTGGFTQKWPNHKYVNSLNDMEITVQSVTGCMGGPETEVELGRRGWQEVL